MIGKVLDVDLVGSGRDVWKRFIRVRVGMDVSRPLETGFPMERVNLHWLWIPFKFEKLGCFCYGCGTLGHDNLDCLDEKIQKLLKESTTSGIYGKWLRAENPKF